MAAQEHDSQTALQNVEAALAIYREHGAGHLWIDRVNAARNQTWVTPTATEGPSEATASSTEATASISTNLGRPTFRLEGEYWTLSYQGDVFRLRDTKGLQYIAYLLRHPGQQVLSIELAALSAGGDSLSKGSSADATASGHLTSDLGNAGEMLDLKALANYRHRREELREDLDDAIRANDPGAEQRARAEWEALSEQLSAGPGQHGQLRTVASHRERARVTVTKRIKKALESIRAADASMARHLATSIQTGHSCCYAPSKPVSWQL